MVDPESAATHGYHLFLEPKDALRDELVAIIKRLANEYGGPVFPPHVTLAGPLEEDETALSARVVQVARQTQAFDLTLGELTGEDTFFRACYIRIPPSTELMQLGRALSGGDDSYVPHLSLFYGSIDDAQRSQMIESIAYPQGASFTVDRIALYRTRGAADTWERIGEYPFAL